MFILWADEQFLFKKMYTNIDQIGQQFFMRINLLGELISQNGPIPSLPLAIFPSKFVLFDFVWPKRGLNRVGGIGMPYEMSKGHF